MESSFDHQDNQSEPDDEEAQDLSTEVVSFLRDAHYQAQKYEAQQQSLEAGSRVDQLVTVSAPLPPDFGNVEDDLLGDSAHKHEVRHQVHSDDATAVRVEALSPSTPQQTTVKRGKTNFQLPPQEIASSREAGDSESSEFDQGLTRRTIETSQTNDEEASRSTELLIFQQSKLVQASFVDHEEPLAIIISTAQQDDSDKQQRSAQRRHRTWMCLGGLLLLLLVIVVTGTTVALTSPSQSGEPALEPPTPNVAPAAVPTPGNGLIFNIIRNNVDLEFYGRTADLVSGNGTLLDASRTYTVFAADFNAFFAQSLNSFLIIYSRDEWLGHVQSLIKQHIVEGTPTLEHGMELKTMAGGTLQISVENGIIQVNGFTIKDPVLAVNGVLYTIQKLLYPSWYTQSLTDVLYNVQAPIERCLELLEFSGILDDVILPLNMASTPVPFTVFCPTNEAFSMFANPEVLDDPIQLRELMNYHLLHSNYVLGIAKLQIQKKKTFLTLQGESLQLEAMEDGEATINGDSRIISADHLTYTGVIHIVDKILTPYR